MAGHIFEGLGETFYRQTCFGISAVASFRKKYGKNMLPKEGVISFDLFDCLWSAGTRFRH